MCPAARGRTDRQTDTHTRKWLLRAPFQGFRISFIQPIIKDRPNNIRHGISIRHYSVVWWCLRKQDMFNLFRFRCKAWSKERGGDRGTQDRRTPDICTQHFCHRRQWYPSYILDWIWLIISQFLGRSLMIGWRKKSWNPERVPSVFTLSVCPSVCPSVCLCAGYRSHILA